jgi:hypothetical protein
LGAEHTKTAARRQKKLARKDVLKHQYFLAAKETLKAACPETKLYAPPKRAQELEPALRA